MDISVVGRHALFFDDDANVLFVNSPEALVPWSENPSLLIDRYDVRHLLQRIPPPPRKNGRRQEIDGDGVSRSDLDRERYLDLPFADGDQDYSETRKDADGMQASGDYQAVPFSYRSSNGDSVQKDSDVVPAYSGYLPPFSLPQGLLNNLPPTEKMHQIIARTVTFVIKNGGQSEIVLRVKQGGNPTFGFLMPDHHLHPYFRYLIDHPELVNNADNVTDRQEKNETGSEERRSPSTEGGGALSLLGSVYGLEEDEEDATHGGSEPSDPKEMEACDSANDAIHKSENGTSSIPNEMEVKASLKPIAVSTEKTLSLKKNPPVVAVPSDDASVEKSKVRTNSSDVSNSRHWLNLPDTSKIVLEPSSSLKRMVDKIVEFIVKNGKEFEAILIEQDRSHGRFPFLLPSNIYHSYYLKVLHEAQETKLLGKSIKDKPLDKADSLRKNPESKGDSASLQDSSKQMEGLYDSSDKRDKFKMVIGGLKKEAYESPPSGSKQSGGISTDAAAAIVMKATRGSSSPTKSQYPTINKQSGMSAEAAAAIVMQATRGSSSPRKSDLSGSSLLLDGEGHNKPNNLIFTNIFAKTAAIAAASEADSSEASLTREQQKKAERLKRAKMLGAMMNKPNGDSKAKLLPTATGSGSALSGSVSDLVRRERDRVGRSIMAVDSGTVPARREEHHMSRKHHNDEDSEENEHEKKKHRSSSSHSRRKRHHSSSKYVDDGSDEEHQHRKKSKSHRHHRRHRHTGSSSDDDDSLHARRQGKSKTTKDEIKVDAQSSGNTTEVPDDLRAKIRAMLLATM